MKPYQIVKLFSVMAIWVLSGPALGDTQPAPQAALVSRYLETARNYQEKNQLVDAAGYYRLVLTVEKNNSDARKAIQRIDADRQQQAEKNYGQGLKHYKAGIYNEATRAFLATLRLWPDHQGALEKLKTPRLVDTTDYPYIPHTIAPGETLGVIAKEYYGDLKKFHLIAQFNEIDNVTRVRVGQKLKIPVVDGSFLAIHKLEETPLTYQKTEKQEAVKQQVADYQEAAVKLLRAGQYEDAIMEFEKVLNAMPEDREIKQHLISAYAHEASRLSAQNRHEPAITKYDRCMEVVLACADCTGAKDECASGYKEAHYNRGIRYYEDELLADAISEWTLVKSIDPNYKQVTHYIDKTEKISQKLNELRQKKDN